MFGRAYTMMISLHGHAFHTDGNPNFNFSALNGMRDIANGHQSRGA